MALHPDPNIVTAAPCPPTQAIPPSVAVVSVTFNRGKELAHLLGQLQSLEYPRHLIETIVVDNASTDDTIDRVRQGFPEVELVAVHENLGVSAGFNRGMRVALEKRTQFIWLLDSDAEIEPTTLAPLVAALESDRTIGVVGSAIYDPGCRERAVTAGIRVDWKSGELRFVVSPDRATDLVDVDLIPACSLLTRSEICHSLGLWDEQFWLYWGDTDWCAHVVQSGWRVCCHVGSRTWHRDWANVPREFGATGVVYDDIRGSLLFNCRNNPRGSMRGTRRLILKGYLKAALENLTGRQHLGLAYRQAIDDFLAGNFLKPDLTAWSRRTPTMSLEQICRTLQTQLPPNPKLLLNQIDDNKRRSAIRAEFDRAFPHAEWHEIPSRGSRRSDLRSEYQNYFRYQLPQFVMRLLTPYRRCDVIITDVAKPHIYALVSARHTVLLDASLHGLTRTNRVITGLWSMLATACVGMKRAFLDLPRAWRSCRPLQVALKTRRSAV